MCHNIPSDTNAGYQSLAESITLPMSIYSTRSSTALEHQARHLISCR
jgi:hypothetical protein